MPWPAFKIFSYTATVDYATPAMRIDLQRTNPDTTPVRGGGGLPLLAPQTQSQAISGKTRVEPGDAGKRRRARRHAGARGRRRSSARCCGR